ncbi:MAG: hypothetical protein HZB51_34350 [Chloroflexi bacterium]|nr:hypothetical protein [Chloroflexota bacterium]
MQDVIVPVTRAYGNLCGDGIDPVSHIFESENIPPHDDERCMCGQTTWKAEVTRMRQLAAQIHLEKEGQP